MHINSPSGTWGKQLLLVRHAKSSWENFSQKDFDRSLTERGKKDAAEMAIRLKQKNILIDLIIASPAKRALQTATIFANEFDIQKNQISKINDLYEPTLNSFYTSIISLSDEYKTVAIFSHNPTITAFANELTNVHIDDMPTASVFSIKINTKNWNNFKDAEKQFCFFDYPKTS